MKLVSYQRAEGQVGFGAVIGEVVVDFADLAASLGVPASGLSAIDAYLSGLPASFDEAKALLDRRYSGERAGARALSSLRLLAPTPRPAALLDCALTPRHLANATATLMRRSLPPGLGRIAGLAMRPLMGRKPEIGRYYKSNRNAVIGDGDVVNWPDFTAYLDIEPELAVVTGAIPVGASREEVARRLAGYLIFNDSSARDVQLPEMFFTGPASSKDFDRSKGLGPFLVTPDEIADPLALPVSVQIGDQEPWTGTTAEYAIGHPLDVVVAIAARQSLLAGTVIGLGTVPDCCGLERDEWIRPGEHIAITIAGLGTLNQVAGVPAAPPQTPWQPRRDSEFLMRKGDGR